MFLHEGLGVGQLEHLPPFHHRAGSGRVERLLTVGAAGGPVRHDALHLGRRHWRAGSPRMAALAARPTTGAAAGRTAPPLARPVAGRRPMRRGRIAAQAGDLFLKLRDPLPQLVALGLQRSKALPDRFDPLRIQGEE